MRYFQQLRAILGCLVVLLTLSASAAAFTSAPHRIVAIGDLHGDFSAWRKIARAAGLIDDTGKWIGGESVLVQTGDVVDRGPDSLKILQDLMRLQRESKRTNGQVIALVGNHEAMNVTGDLRYVSAGDYAAFVDARSVQRREDLYKANIAAIETVFRRHNPEMTSDAIKRAWIESIPLGLIEHQVAWRPDGMIGRWIVGNPAIVLLDGNLFVHGGISPAYANLNIAEINRQVAAALMAQATDPMAIINDPMGPLWYRGLAQPEGEGAGLLSATPRSNQGASLAREAAGAPAAAAPNGPTPESTAPPAPAEPPIEDQLNHILLDYGAKRIVIGHTPNLSGILMSFDGRLIRIDTGISAVFNGKLSYLDIINGNPVPHLVDRASPLEGDVQ